MVNKISGLILQPLVEDSPPPATLGVVSGTWPFALKSGAETAALAPVVHVLQKAAKM
jgi:hypothetical protein